MPGLATKGRTVVEPGQPSPHPPKDRKSAITRERRVSTSSDALKRYMDHVEKPSPVPLKPERIRTRTFSTPAGPRSPPASSGRPATPKTTGFALATPITQAEPISRGP
ncbi:hypothetical protein PENSPDRAFT_685918 [Peniophora sp. CONT]|nr:hypothetical protein PENSPDRAFT_685918 [Peniophora sp. CONT]